MKKIIFLILLSFSNSFIFSHISYADSDGQNPKTQETINTQTEIKNEKTKQPEQVAEKIESSTTTTITSTGINEEKTFNQKFKEFAHEVDDFMTRKWNEAKIFWDNWDSDENIQFTTFELPKIVIPKITFPKLDDVKFYPIKNKNIFIDITSKNETETKILGKLKEVLQLSNKITENKDTSDTILTGEIIEKHKEISNDLTSYGIKLKLHFTTNKNEKRNIILNVDNSINNTDFISLQNQVLNTLYNKIEKTFKNK